MIRNWINKLLGKIEVNIITPQYGEILRKANVKYLPRVGDLIYFDDDGDYFLVIKVIHRITNKQVIWVMVEELFEKKVE